VRKRRGTGKKPKRTTRDDVGAVLGQRTTKNGGKKKQEKKQVEKEEETKERRRREEVGNPSSLPEKKRLSVVYGPKKRHYSIGVIW
jgi:hypothetical protein